MCYSKIMPGFDITQRQVQKQVQTLSQKQIQSLNILKYDSDELRSLIYAEIEKNPALTVSNDSFQQGREKLKDSRKTSLDHTRTRNATHEGELASDNYQRAMEAVCDEMETLQDHLISQLNMAHISQKKLELCTKLVHNLNDKGYHLLSPYSLLPSEAKKEDLSLLEECIEFIQQLDPPGTCVKDVSESLYVQAKMKDSVPPYTLLILNGHLDFLTPALPEKIARKINDFIKEQSNLFGQAESLESPTCTIEQASDSLNFIRQLNPYPTGNFGPSENHYIQPDVYVMPTQSIYEESDEDKGIISNGNASFKVTLGTQSIPRLDITDTYKKIANSEDEKITRSLSKEQLKEVSENVKSAQDFIEAIEFRQNTVMRTTLYIVQKQIEFFIQGPGHLVPLTQKEIAQHLDLSDSTISRTANSKFVETPWGIFMLKDFFTNSVSVSNEGDSPDTLSKDNILHAIKLILDEHKNDDKKLSDQKISDILAEKGIKVARRTVAKYRTAMEIESSYNRV